MFYVKNGESGELLVCAAVVLTFYRNYFHSCKIFEENLVTVELGKLDLEFNRPIYVEMAILNISKTLLSDLNYNFVLKFPTADTDSLIYEFQCKDIYKQIILENLHKFEQDCMLPDAVDCAKLKELNRMSLKKRYIWRLFVLFKK